MGLQFNEIQKHDTVIGRKGAIFGFRGIVTEIVGLQAKVEWTHRSSPTGPSPIEHFTTSEVKTSLLKVHKANTSSN